MLRWYLVDGLTNMLPVVCSLQIHRYLDCLRLCYLFTSFLIVGGSVAQQHRIDTRLSL